MYGCGFRSGSGWGLEYTPGELESSYNGILMEWIEGAEELSEDNITLDLAANFIRGLARIHSAGVLHADTFTRNMSVVPSKKRSVWLDFSCAAIGAEAHHNEELWGAAGIAIGLVLAQLNSFADLIKLMDRTKKETVAEFYKRYDLSTISLFRRVCCLIYVSWLLIEGLISAFDGFNATETSAFVPLGMKYSTMCFQSAGLALTLLHVYIGSRLLGYFFRSIVLCHQMMNIAISLWTYVQNKSVDHIGSGFQLILFFFCALGESQAFIRDMIECCTSPNSQVG